MNPTPTAPRTGLKCVLEACRRAGKAQLLMSPWATFYATALQASGWPRWCAMLEAESVDWSVARAR